MTCATRNGATPVSRHQVIKVFLLLFFRKRRILSTRSFAWQNPSPASSAKPAAPSRRNGRGAARPAPNGTRSPKNPSEARPGLPAKGDAPVPARLALESLTGTVEPPPRLCTKIEELDRVLGGGLVAAPAVLVGGDPGIGKSTLLLQAAASVGAGPARGCSIFRARNPPIRSVCAPAGSGLDTRAAVTGDDDQRAGHRGRAGG